MNREELIKLLQSWLTTATDDNGNPIHVIMDVDIHEIATEIIKSSLPPAEGAEAFLRSHKISGADFVYTTGFENMVELLREFAAQQQPTAEGAELKDDKPCNKCTYNGHTTICEQCNDGNDYEHFTYNDPYSKESMNFFKVFIKARKDLCAISPTETYSLEEAIRKAFDGFFPKPLSIVDDAEKILYSHPYLKVWIENLYDSEMRVCSIEQAIWAIEKAATLHAQRIADKMVDAKTSRNGC